MAAELHLIEAANDKAEVVRILESYLERAKAGDLAALAISAVGVKGTTFYNLARTSRGSTADIVAAASIAQHVACREWEKLRLADESEAL